MTPTIAAEEIRMKINMMLRRSLTDREIMYELARVYGNNVVLVAKSVDRSTRNRHGLERRAAELLFGSLGGSLAVYMAFRFLRLKR